MSVPLPQSGFFKSLLREPLLHFLLVGALVFGLYPGSAAAPRDPEVIEITDVQIGRLTEQFEGIWRRPPNEDELSGMIAEQVKEEVLYREALALGLDRDDTVVRQRLRLKMEFIGEGAAAALMPEDGELESWYADNASAFTAPPRASLTQIVLNDPAEAAAILVALEGGADPATLGRVSLLPPELDDATSIAVDATFGPGFFRVLAALPLGEWQGPLQSSVGLHLVFLRDRTAPAAPPLADVRDDALNAWREDQADALREAQYQVMLSRYEVRLPRTAAP